MFNGLPILIIFFIIGPIIRGLIEAQNKRREWEKRQEGSLLNGKKISIPIQPKQYKSTAKEFGAIPRKHSNANTQDIIKQRTSIDTGTPSREPILSSASATAQPSQRPVEQLFTSGSLCRAIILKEILDPPKALRRR